MQTKYLSHEEALIKENEQLIAWQQELTTRLDALVSFVERQSGAKHKGGLWFYREEPRRIFSIERNGKVVDQGESFKAEVLFPEVDTTPAA